MSTSDKVNNNVNTNNPPAEDNKKWSFLGWGLLFLVVWMVGLMFILQVALHPADSIIATIIAYSLGLLGLGIFAGLTRSKWKVLVTFPLAILIVFGLGFLLHFIHAPIYNPLAPISERAIVIANNLDDIAETSIGSSLPPEILDNLANIQQYAPASVLIDVVITIPVFLFGTLAVTWLVQIFTQKPKWWVIFSGLFALMFLIIGLIITPMVHLVIASVVDLGTNMGMGLVYLMGSFSVFTNINTANQTEVNAAIQNANIASDWFKKGGEDISVMLSALKYAPYIGPVADDLNYLAQAVIILTGGLGPFVNATYRMVRGFNLINEAFNGSLGGTTSFNAQGDQISKALDDAKFNEGIEYINEALEIYNENLPMLNDSINQVNNVNWTDVKNALHEIPDMDSSSIDPILDSMKNYTTMFKDAPAILQIFTDKPTYENGTTSHYSTLIHFLLGAYNLIKAEEVIGDTTHYTGTEVYFTRAGEHLNLTYNYLVSKPTINKLINSDTPYINGTLAFVVDMTGLAADLSFFGAKLSPLLENLNNTLSVFSNGYENVSDYNSIRENLNTSIFQIADLNVTAVSIDHKMDGVMHNASIGLYGEFSDIAEEFSTNFKQFNLTTNIDNAYYIANSFYYLFGAMQNLKLVKENVDAGFVAFRLNTSAGYIDAANHFSSANDSLTDAISDMWNASWYFNKTVSGGMIQLGTARDSIAVIYFAMLDIQTDISGILVIVNGSPSSSDIPAIQNYVDDITSILQNVNNDLASISAQ